MKPINLTAFINAYKQYHSERWSAEHGFSNDVESACRSYLEAVAPITAVIAEEQVRCRERLLDPDDIADACIEIENALRISKKNMVGVSAVVDPNAQTFCRSYQKASHGNRPESTQFAIFYKANGWHLNCVQRTYCGARRLSISLPETAKKAITDRIERGEI